MNINGLIALLFSVDWFITRHAPHLLPSHTDIEGTAKHLEYMHYAEVRHPEYPTASLGIAKHDE